MLECSGMYLLLLPGFMISNVYIVELSTSAQVHTLAFHNVHFENLG